MEQSKDIRYNTKLIWTTIFLISLIATLITTFITKNKEISNLDNLPSSISQDFYSFIDSSLYKDNVNYSINEEFDYYVRSYKIKNYPFTQEYKEKYPNNVVARDNSGEYIYGYNASELKTNQDITEEPVFITNYLSNRILTEDFDPQKVDLDKNDIFVRGFYEIDTENINITEKNIPLNSSDKYNKQTKKMYDYFIITLKDVYGNINPSDNGIKKINFAYSFRPDADFISKSVYRDDYLYNAFEVMLMGIAISMFVVAVFAIVTNYRGAKEVSFYLGISRYPLEIVVIAVGLWMASISTLGSTFIVDNFFKYLDIILPIAQFIAILTASIAVYYLIYGIKSVYNEGFKSFVFEKSIIVKIFKAIKKGVLNILSRTKIGLDATDYKKYIIAYAALMLLGFIACNTVVHYGGEIVFILWFVLVTSIFAYFREHIKSLREIESVTDSIAKGDYSLKVDEYNNKFKKITDNINNISNNLNTAVEKAVKSERMKTELITNVSHDLKTPLTSIINYSELINCGKTKDEDIKEYAKIINEKSHKLKNIIEDLFEISKASSNNIELHLENLDFKSLVSQVIGEWEDKLEEKGLDLIINLPEKSVMKELDGNKTSRVLDNLFSNIEKYALENTRVYVDLTEDEKAKLIIKNISKYSLNISSEELLERFTRGDSSRNTQGSGLGLSIASSLVAAQGGKFKLDIDGDLFKTIVEF
ncbi:sensor histidine kinase [Peptoniphilus sp. ING2-D1G]|nr:sensor histidine kinase [Peptoniphilus sp. ING2-D1G]